MIFGGWENIKSTIFKITLLETPLPQKSGLFALKAVISVALY